MAKVLHEVEEVRADTFTTPGPTSQKKRKLFTNTPQACQVIESSSRRGDNVCLGSIEEAHHQHLSSMPGSSKIDNNVCLGSIEEALYQHPASMPGSSRIDFKVCVGSIEEAIH